MAEDGKKDSLDNNWEWMEGEKNLSPPQQK